VHVQEDLAVTLREFLNRYPVKLSSRWVDSNPNMEDRDWAASHYRCLLRHDGRQMSVYFSMGSALCREPTLDDVLDCLASDAAGVESACSFEDWCGEYGYDTDSRKAEHTYKTCERQAVKLRRLLGDGYETLLWETER
jgi:hypothetical protein